MPSAHLLDRPAWNALRTGWAPLAEGPGHALRLARGYGPFGAVASGKPENLEALVTLVPPDDELWLVEAEPVAVPPGAVVVRTRILTQMFADRLAPRPPLPDMIDLTEQDAAEMRALAAMTKPGPFGPLTHRLGAFVGLCREGRLVAMAGERMRLDGYCEVSGVCTHPDHRGQGFAGALMSIVAERIRARGETPFLHSYAENAGAIALYEALGFRARQTIQLTVIAPRERFEAGT
jgi:ribosomal protein S18 acetylase RimI-like enzyme